MALTTITGFGNTFVNDYLDSMGSVADSLKKKAMDDFTLSANTATSAADMTIFTADFKMELEMAGAVTSAMKAVADQEKEVISQASR